MRLATRNLLVTSEAPPPLPKTPLDFEFGWTAVRRGLHSILLGNLVAIGMVLFAVALAFCVVTSILKARGVGEFVDTALLVYAGIGILFLLGVLSLSLIIKGQIGCLLSAPERCGARWLMFASALCVIVGPALNLTASFVGTSAKRPSAPLGTKHTDAAAEVRVALRAYGESLLMRDTRAYISLVGDAAGLLSGIFFVLFMRAVARCFNDTVRMRIAELYLVVSGLLFAATVFLFLKPQEFLRHPGWVMGLGSGWVVAGLWYILLLLSTSACIAEGLARRRSPLDKLDEEGAL